MEMWAAQRLGEEENGVQSKFLIPTEKEDITRKGFLESFLES